MNPTCIVLATVISALILTWPGHAQDKPQQGASTDAVLDAPEPLLNLDFRGGSAAEYVAAIRKAAADANIIVVSDISSIPLPPVQLKGVDIQSALNVLNSVQQDQPGHHVEVRVGADMPSRNRPTAERPVFTVSAQFGGRLAGTDRDSMVMDISDILGTLNAAGPKGQDNAADVLTAVEAALQMLQGEYQPAQIKFHEATGLLIARGHPEQIGAIQRVISQLNEKAARTRHRAEEASNAKADAARVLDISAQLDQTRRQMEDLARQSAEWKTKSDVLQAELARARDELQDRNHFIQQLQQQLSAISMERDQKKP